MTTEKSSPQPAPAHDYTPHGPWEARCRDCTYKGGDWPRDQFLQWEVYGPDEPIGRGSFFREEALLVAAAPDMLAALQAAHKALDRLMAQVISLDTTGEFMPTKSPAWPAMLAVHAAIAKATGAQA